MFNFGEIHEKRQILLKAGKVFIQKAEPAALSDEVLHPYVGFVRNPSADDKENMLSRSGPFPARGKEEILIAVTGGSVARQFCSEGAPVLQAKFPQKTRLFCLADNGYKQPQQLMLVTYLLSAGAQFDVLINLDGFNEIVLPVIENLPKKVHPSYPRKWFFRTGALYDEQSLADMGGLVWLRRTRTRLVEFFEKPPVRWSAAASVLWECLDRWFEKQEYLVYAVLYARPTGMAWFEQTGPPYQADSNEKLYGDLSELWFQSSLQLHYLCEANGIRYFHFLQPNQYVPGSKLFSAEERTQFISDESPYRVPAEAGYPYLIRAGRRLRERGVRFRDLSMLFEKETQTVYKDSCCHLNSYGYARLGEVIGEDLAA